MTDQRSSREVLKGFGLGLLMQLLQFPLNLVFQGGRGDGFILPVPVFVIGLSQLFYIVPLVIYLQKKDRQDMAKGVMIAAALIALLNATCFGVLMFGGIRIAG